jgi:hypothetical protein
MSDFPNLDSVPPYNQPPNYQPPPNYQQPPNYNQPPNYQQPPNYPPPLNNQPNYNQGYQQFPPPPSNMYNPYGGYGLQADLPGSTQAQICGIIGLVLFWNLIGIILNIIAVAQGSNALNEYKRFPDRYSQSSLSKAKAGRTCGIIGLSILGFGILIVFLAIVANV